MVAKKANTCCTVQLLPAETLCSILKAALDNIVEDDMMLTPKTKYRTLEGGLPFPHTIALHCILNDSGAREYGTNTFKTTPTYYQDVRPSSNYTSNASGKIGAEKVILLRSIDALAVIDDDCQTIVFRNCNYIEATRVVPSSKSLEFDGYTSRELRQSTPQTSRKWRLFLHEVFLGAPLSGRIMGSSQSRWPRVTTLKLLAKGDFVMKFPLNTLKRMISGRREAAGQSRE
ncbi:hypothetical protein EDB19DRAFT_2022926 [Suillus lakei]|nr:hypothetical protein EDB19DRAFT_2022926 [Suillus lakei]